jgi:hypothetical protein
LIVVALSSVSEKIAAMQTNVTVSPPPLFHWLLALAHRHGLQMPGDRAFGPDHDSALGLRYGALDIVVEHDAQGCVHLHTVLVAQPDQHRDGFFQKLLELNAFGQATGGAVLALDPHDQAVLLCAQAASAQLDEAAFEAWFIHFVRHAQALRDLLAQGIDIPSGSVRV